MGSEPAVVIRATQDADVAGAAYIADLADTADIAAIFPSRVEKF